MQECTAEGHTNPASGVSMTIIRRVQIDFGWMRRGLDRHHVPYPQLDGRLRIGECVAGPKRGGELVEASAT